VLNVNRHSTVGQFFSRYARWTLIQRQGVGRLLHLAQLPLFPIACALMLLAVAPSLFTLGVFAFACALRCLCDQLTAMQLRPGGFKPWSLLLIPVKEIAMFGIYLSAIFRNTVLWRGHRLRVGPNTVILPPERRRRSHEPQAV
jgi:ceramide glucosyltransferase